MARLIGSRIHALDEVASTQSALAALASGGAPEGTVVTARHQTGGRGRQGRRWWDAPGESLLLSALLRPSIPPARIPELSLVAGLAITDALDAGAGLRGCIRWPNDVLIGGRKVCGILAEAMSVGTEHVGQIILGIGLNVNQTAFPVELADGATSVRMATGRAHEPERLLAAVLDALDRRYREWLAGGFAGLRAEWRGRATTIGARVLMPDGRPGVAVDVAEDGALLVAIGDGAPVRVVSGTFGEEPAGPAAEAERDAARH